MAIEIFLRPHPSGTGFVPASEADADAMAEASALGGVFKATLTQPRHIMLHRRGMALFRALYNLWEPVLDRAGGAPVRKDFDAFREAVTIEAGFYDQVFSLEEGGGFQLRAQSISWANMDNIRFARVYSEVINVGLRMIGKADHLTPAQVDEAVERLLGFAR